jgi:hypothetical protein
MSMQTTTTAVRICRCGSTAPACPILSLFIALAGDSPSSSKCKTRFTLKTMTPSIPKPESLLRGALQLLCGGSTRAALAPQSPMHANEPRTGGVLQPNDPAAATLSPRFCRLIGLCAPYKFHVIVKIRCWSLLHDAQDAPRPSYRLLTFALFHKGTFHLFLPILHPLCGRRLNSSPCCLPRVGAAVH